MPDREYIGARLREARRKAGIRQGALARQVGISASYLNLIEHDRRRIAGKLVTDLARALKVAPDRLTQGTGARLTQGLQSAAAAHPDAEAELDQLDQLASRFPGWTRLIAAQDQRDAVKTREIEALADRMAHDPFLAETLHAILSAVTAVRSISSILHQSPGVDAEWRTRFHANLFEDSNRLAETTRALVAYFDQFEGGAGAAQPTPLEYVEAGLCARGFRLPRLERTPEAVEEELASWPPADSATVFAARAALMQYGRDARALPAERLDGLVARLGVAPRAIVEETGLDPALVLRRLAGLPDGRDRPALGLLVCDATGTLTLRKPLDGFATPRIGAGCARWPLYEALQNPAVMLRRVLALQGGQRVTAFAAGVVHRPRRASDRGGGAVMLIVDPAGAAQQPGGPPPSADTDPLEVGPSCRICPVTPCPARREASILAPPR